MKLSRVIILVSSALKFRLCLLVLMDKFVSRPQRNLNNPASTYYENGDFLAESQPLGDSLHQEDDSFYSQLCGINDQTQGSFKQNLSRVQQKQQPLIDGALATQSFLMNQSTSQLALQCNKAAMEKLRAQNFKIAHDLLKESEQLLLTAEAGKDITEHERVKLLALTYNNLGCLYKKKQQLNVALQYLKKAMHLEVQNQQDTMNIAGTLLNICAILSSMKKHRKAILYAHNCIQRSEKVLSQLNESYPLSGDSGSDTSRDKVQRTSYIKNIYTTLVIAHYNLGVEHEHLHEYALSIDFFNRAMQLNKDHLQSDPHMGRFISEGLQSVQSKYQKKLVIINAYGGQNITFFPSRGSEQSGGSPRRIMIDMNSSRFQPLESKRSQSVQKTMYKVPMAKEGTRALISTRIQQMSESSYTSTQEKEPFQTGTFYSKQLDATKNPIIKDQQSNLMKLIYQKNQRKAVSTMRNYGLPINRGLNQIISESPEVQQEDEQIQKDLSQNPYVSLILKKQEGPIMSRNKILPASQTFYYKSQMQGRNQIQPELPTLNHTTQQNKVERPTTLMPILESKKGNFKTQRSQSITHQGQSQIKDEDQKDDKLFKIKAQYFYLDLHL